MRSCIILCGGRSRRMGQDKGLMLFEKQPLIIHLLETLKSLVDEIVLVFRDKKQINSYEKHINSYLSSYQNHTPQLKLAVDPEKDQGPLVGLGTGLSLIKADGALVLPCDSPFVSPQFITNIFKISASLVNKDEENKVKGKKDEHEERGVGELKFQAIIPTWSDGSIEPLHAYYRKECIPSIQKQLKTGFRDVKSVLKLINVNYVDVDVLDPEKTSFINLNRPEDLNSISHSENTS
ncbi:MAG: molybdenum cofactor guanylyltransferase [Methanobacterium sp.]|nr:molybdenum cofactor guanylyltransferase [Methanobacterium sp.]